MLVVVVVDVTVDRDADTVDVVDAVLTMVEVEKTSMSCPQRTDTG